MRSKRVLTELADRYGTDKGSRKHRYTDAYDLFLGSRRQSVFSVLELGVARGDSLKMWAEYFPHAQVYGIDRQPSPELGARIKTRIADQGDRDSIERALEWFGESRFDIVLDDGSHLFRDQVASLQTLRTRVREGGFYIVEDVRPVRDGQPWEFFENRYELAGRDLRCACTIQSALPEWMAVIYEKR